MGHRERMEDRNKTTYSTELPEMGVADVAVTYRQLAEEEWDKEEYTDEDVAADDEDDEGEEGGFIRYNRAFIAKMSLAADNLKAYYNVLKNALLSYKGVKSRLSWCFDSFNCGRHQLVKINVRGNGLIVYLALDSAAYLGTKYRFRDVGHKKKFADVPMQIKVKSKRGLRYALELSADVMRRFDIGEGKPQAVAYAPERESVETLMRRNLVRVVGQSAIEEAAADETPDTAPLADASPSPDTAQKPVDVPPVSVDAAKAEAAMTDAEARGAIEVVRAPRRKGKRKAVVNVDVLCRNFVAGELVNVNSLVRRRLVSPQCGYLKICARGALDKPLTVEADDFSLVAVKMIVLTGGKAVRVKGD